MIIWGITGPRTRAQITIRRAQGVSRTHFLVSLPPKYLDTAGGRSPPIGTYVGVFGTTVDGTNPNRQCTVDGSVIPNNDLTAAENGVMHCQVNGLADGKHTLVVTVPTANPSGYWFDYLMYIPSASVSTTNAALTYINGDPSMNFGTGWSQGGPGYIATSNGATFNMQFTGE